MITNDDQGGEHMIDWTLTGIAAGLAGSVGVAALAAAAPEEVRKMAKEEARAMLDGAEITAIDVRMPHDWDPSDVKIPGAIREDPKDVSSWADKYPKDKALLLY